MLVVHHLSAALKLIGITVLLMTPLVGANADVDISKKVVPIITLLLNESFYRLLNDTGITWGGDYESGNKDTCTSNISGPQDCNQGRDATHNDDSDGHAGFSFTKLDENGNPLVDQSIDYATTPWSCVKDNVTGLVWEVKQNKNGVEDAENIHDADNKYEWGGTTAQGPNYGVHYREWDELVDGSNNASFCGFKDWRVPTINELENLVSFNRTDPSIDTDYFPNTYASNFWSASPLANNQNDAWYVFFHDGQSNNYDRGSEWRVRLVRSG